MSHQLRDILKYFFLTFLSLEIMYIIAKGKPNLLWPLILALCFTFLYSISKLSLVDKLLNSRQTFGKGIVNKDKAL